MLQTWLAERDLWLATHPKPWNDQLVAEYEQEFSRRIERWLDEGRGSCVMRQPAFRDVVSRALHHFDDERYSLDSYVVMPNHVHVLVKPLADHTLAEILQSWKGFTARQINKLLDRTGEFWSDESFDHAVRSEAQLGKLRDYIRENPTNAGLKSGQFTVWQRMTAEEGSGRLESLRHTMAADLGEIGRTRMPFGKFGPEHFPPNGIPIYDLPAEYLMWFANKAGFPKGRLGQLLQMVYQMKADGSDMVFDVFRKRTGGKTALRQPARKTVDLQGDQPDIPF